MANPLNDTAGRLVAIVVALTLLIGGGYWWGSSVKEAKWQRAWSQRNEKDRNAQKAFTDEQRRLELKRQGEIDAIQQQYAAKLAAADANLNAARAQSKRLQSGIDAALAQLRGGGVDTGTVAERQAKDQAGLLLSQLFREINDRSVALAGEADDAWLRGKQCEASYDALVLKKAAR